MFCYLMIRRFWFKEDTKIPEYEIILVMLIVFQAFYKILFFLKINSNYGFLVQMIKQSIIDITGFLTFFAMWILFFTIQYKVLGAEFGLDDYPGLNNFAQLALISFRNSIGDIQVAAYSNLQTEDTYLSWGIIWLIWLYWFLNIGLMCIILMNFLIAVISESYANVSGSKTQYVYKDKADMNSECQQLLSTIFPQQDLKIVSFSSDKSLWSMEEDPNQGVIDSVTAQISSCKSALSTQLKTTNDSLMKVLMDVKTAQADLKKMFAT